MTAALRPLALRSGLLTALASLFVATSANAQVLVVNNDIPADIYMVDVVTDTSFSIATLPEGAWALAADETGGRLFAIELGDDLLEIPYDTRQPTNLGQITVAGATGFVSFVGLAWDDATDTLYASRSTGANNAPRGIYTINLTTLEATLVVDLTNSAFDYGGLAFNPADGLLYGTHDVGNIQGDGQLLSIDPATGTETVIAQYPGSAAMGDLDGLAVGDNRAYLAEDRPGEIFVYDLATDVYLTPLTNPIPVMGPIFGGAAWSPTLLTSPTPTPGPTSTATPTALPTSTPTPLPPTPSVTAVPATSTPTPVASASPLPSTPTMPADATPTDAASTPTLASTPSPTATSEPGDGSGAACPCGVGSTVPVLAMAVALSLLRRRARPARSTR